jgi:hypothetical protein
LRKSILAPLIAALAVVLLAVPAQAHSHPAMTQPAPSTGHPAPGAKVDFGALLLGAELSGKKEVPTPGGPKVGDPDGRAKARLFAYGDKITFSLEWSGISAPTLAHIHQGRKGVNGPIKTVFFAEKGLPATATATAGLVTVTDAKLAAAIKKDPTDFYVNIHTAEFPGGAVRGQLKRLDLSAGMVDVVKKRPLFAFMNGGQEVPVPGGPAVGDPDAFGISFVDATKNKVDYSLAWLNVKPTLGHIHKGGFGTNGPVVVPLFTTPIPSTIFALAGTVPVDKHLAKKICDQPGGFYVNLHSAEFPGGAIRGQLSKP